MTWKCGRLMRQLDFRECVDGWSFMYRPTLNRQGDKTELWEDHFFGVSRSCICQQCARGNVCLWEIERLCLQSHVEEFWRASVVDPGAKPHRKQLSGLKRQLQFFLVKLESILDECCQYKDLISSAATLPEACLLDHYGILESWLQWLDTTE